MFFRCVPVKGSLRNGEKLLVALRFHSQVMQAVTDFPFCCWHVLHAITEYQTLLFIYIISLCRTVARFCLSHRYIIFCRFIFRRALGFERCWYINCGIVTIVVTGISGRSWSFHNVMVNGGVHYLLVRLSGDNRQWENGIISQMIILI